MVFFLALIYFFIILALEYFGVFHISYERLGVPVWLIILMFLIMLLTGLLNILIVSEKESNKGLKKFIYFGFWHQKNKAKHINMGLFLIPIFFSLFMLKYVSIVPTLIVILSSICAAGILANVKKEININLSLIFLFCISLGVSFLVSPYNAAPVFFIAGTAASLAFIGFSLLIKSSKYYYLDTNIKYIFHSIFIMGIISLLI